MSEGIEFLLGFIVGAGGVGMMILSMRIGARRNLKEYLFTLDPDSRKIMDGKIKQLYESVESLAIMTNSRFFKTMHNTMVQLRTYLTTLWMQN